MEELFGLPAHPLLVHFPIVAIPTVTLLSLAVAISPSFRQRFGLATAALGVVTLISTFLAANSGEKLAETYVNSDFVDEHEALGETLRLFVLGMVVSMISLLAFARRQDDTDRHPLTIVLSIALVVFAILSAIWTVRTGHEGARLKWG